MSKITLATLPSNMRVPGELRRVHVEGDVFNICERIAELDERLFITMLHADPQGYIWGVAQITEDGSEELITKVKELDSRVIEHVRYMMSVPLADRVAKIEKENAKWEQEQHELEMERLYENIGAPMRNLLYKTAFTDSRPTSYPIVKRK